MKQIPAPPQMRFLAELGIPHGVSRTPNGSYALTFGHVSLADSANALLTAAGYRVTAVPFNRRGLIATAPPKLTMRERHPIGAHRTWVGFLIVILPVFYISVPVYAWVGCRWYRRTRGVSVWTAVRRANRRRASAARHSARPNYI